MMPRDPGGASSPGGPQLPQVSSAPPGAPSSSKCPQLPQDPIPHGCCSSGAGAGLGKPAEGNRSLPGGRGADKAALCPQCPASCQAARWQGLAVPRDGDTVGGGPRTTGGCSATAAGSILGQVPRVPQRDPAAVPPGSAGPREGDVVVPCQGARGGLWFPQVICRKKTLLKIIS